MTEDHSNGAVAGLKAVACFEALKGVLVLLLGFGLLSLVHNDVHAVAEHLIERLHVNAERPFAHAFLDAADRLTDGRLWAIAAGGAAYAAVRFAEAWGLWFNRAWAQLFAILSGALYLPWEVYEIERRPTPVRIGLLVANAVVVLYLMAVRLHQMHAPDMAAAGRDWWKKESHVHGHEPWWPSLVALLGIGVLHLALPEQLTAGPSWLLLILLACGSIPAIVSHRLGYHRINQATGYVLLSVSTAALLWGLMALIAAMLDHHGAPLLLLRSAALLWLSNVLVFASWYWRLDAGGPHARSVRGHHRQGAFLFPQMTLQEERYQRWRPGFVDYLFLAFNTSTAFSPTDSAVLSRWAKGLMMIQALISLATVVVLAARAVNVL